MTGSERPRLAVALWLLILALGGWQLAHTRVVMLLDVWNPHLSPVECEAVTALVETIGDFNRAAEIEEPENH